MARRPGDGPVYDDDDYLPPGQPAATGPPGKRFVVVAAAGLIIGAVVVVFLLRSQRTAEHAEARVTRNGRSVTVPGPDGAGMRPTRPAPPASHGNPGENWEKVVGTWRREPRGRDDAGYPFRFEFAPDFTAAVTRIGSEGVRETLRGRVRVEEDRDDRLRVIFSFTTGFHTYRFQLLADGTLLGTPDIGDSQTFTREE
jgi:hypothetical protein